MILKFRVYDNENKKMHYLDSLQSVRIFNDGSGYIMDSDHDNTVICAFYPDYLPKKNHLEWSTGLTDKNGKEIYKGDIIQSISSNGNPIKHEVIWDAEHARFAVMPYPKDYIDTPSSVYQSWIDKCKKEIIGNIHE